MTDSSRPSGLPSVAVAVAGSASGSLRAQSAEQHRAAAPRNIKVAVLTISDTRTAADDTSGQYLLAELKAAGHRVVHYQVVRDDAVDIRSTLVLFVREATVVLTTGGTGITGRDVTVPVVESMITKPIPGFGELFRMLSYPQIGGAAMLSRALGGLCRGAAIFALPGSLNAVKTAWEGILRDEIGHLAFEIERHGQPGVLAPTQALLAAPHLHVPLIPSADVVAPAEPGAAGSAPLLSLHKPGVLQTAEATPQSAEAQARAAAAGTAKLGRHQKEPPRL